MFILDSATPNRGFTYSPNKLYKNGCTVGFYTNDGREVATPIYCAQGDDFSCRPNQLMKSRYSPNTCLCNKDGTSAVCNLMSIQEGPPKTDFDPDVFCEPRKVFYIDCDICTCGADGKIATCILSKCPLIRRNYVCEPGKTFKPDCNTCTCDEDIPYSATCTNMSCGVTRVIEPGTNPDPITPPHHRCEPNSHFKLDCHDCYCSEDGTSLACHELHFSCPLPLGFRRVKKLEYA
ncbi:hypothetical protein QAD02_010908 [Eretmocerus hayati]|uniref:Uncharacterized protein n=1 Tax=Eretmocerus hayati TaxID=131215 RepID=A0ACC2NVL4_9HYME|nr:hypothetical protein QAD02_010908 [Eretmocerus hayati]